ncbi:MAG: protein-L-isoaspartate(D-aspartate) O-methyltransferase, partial [Patescibacteria group bacterium]|nr:protein-L-isoaspartate(D-aspartate) O-methyltransferase [Patescibacteria group bacterium]
MLRFRPPPAPFSILSQRLIAMVVSLAVVAAAMFAFLGWIPPDEEQDRTTPERTEVPSPADEHAPDADVSEATAGWVEPAYPNEDPRLREQRRRMVEDDLLGRDIDHAGTLRAMGRIARHRFVSESLQDLAYADRPLPIGHDQTISQPYIVALMTQLAEPKPTDRALDVGTGSGYQAAVLAELCAEVYGIEIVEGLAELGARRLAELGYQNATIRHGDGFRGWPEKAPFDIIIVAAAPAEIPQPLIEQLAPGGRLVIPVGGNHQQLVRLRKQPDGSVLRETIIPVRFVPMT